MWIFWNISKWKKSICQVWLSIWTGCGFYFLCLPLCAPFLWEQTQSAAFLERILAYSSFWFGNSRFPHPPCSLVGVKASLCFIAPMREQEAKIDWSLWSGVAGKINMADLLLWAGQASHLLSACPYFHHSEWNGHGFPGPPHYSKTDWGVAAGLFKQVSCMLSGIACKRWSQPFTSPCVFASLQCDVAVLSIKK